QQLSKDDLEKSGTPEELIRLSIGLEGIDDILADLDQAINKATNEKPSIKQSKEDVIKSLLQSPFSRKDGIVRKKVIALIGANNESDKLITKIEELNNLGLHILSIGDKIIPLTQEVLSYLKDNPYDVDVAWLHGSELEPTLTK